MFKVMEAMSYATFSILILIYGINLLKLDKTNWKFLKYLPILSVIIGLAYMCSKCCVVYNDGSGWTCEQVNLFTWRGQNHQEFSMPCHGIFLTYSFSKWKISSDVAKYLMTCHQILCHVTKIFFRINKALLTLNMGLVNRVLECSLMWGLENKRK